MNLVKFILRGKLDGHTNLFNTQALFYAVLPHRVKVINVYQMGAYFNISTYKFLYCYSFQQKPYLWYMNN